MNIAILGFGTVGGGVYDLLADGAKGITVRRVLDIRRPDGMDDATFTDNIGDILGDPEIDCVVETIGGIHPALGFVETALRLGKSVVTANKELISHALAPLSEIALMRGVHLRYGASVGGGIPWLDNLARQARADTILALDGIANGTTNFILDAMGRGEDFADVLATAQRLGYAEADPSADLDGIDVQRKCAISASCAFGGVVDPPAVSTLGIAGIRAADVAAFSRRGLTCKLMMHAGRMASGVYAYVEPTLLGPGALAAHTPANFNCISLYARHAGQLSFYGQGAGRYPTAESILRDLLDVAANAPRQAQATQPLAVDNESTQHRYYVRAAAPERFGLHAVEALGDGIVTAPMPVAQAHAAIRALYAAEQDTFAAGLPEQSPAM